MKRQKNQRLQSVLLATITIIFLLGAFHSTYAQQGAGKPYDARDPRTCADMKAPAKGAMTVALATKYLICASEGVQGDYLYLIEDVQVQVGGGVPYNPRDLINVSDIDVKALVFPLRASFTQYQCGAVSDASENRGHNCTVYKSPKATGVCYKTTFGDWNCNAREFGSNATERDARPPGYTPSVAPAKDKPTAAAKTGAGDNKDENGFPKPDFSDMEKYYEIIRYEYSPANRTFSFVAKMTKEVNPNDFEISFYDSDGANLSKGMVVWSEGDSDRKPGDVHKFTVGMPWESVMKRVTKVVITRHIY